MSAAQDHTDRPVAHLKHVEHVEQWVRDACRDLGLPMDGGADDFFMAGGTSLTVLRLVARAEEEFGDDALPPDDLFEHSSFRGIAASIVRNSAAAAGSADDVTAPPPATA